MSDEPKNRGKENFLSIVIVGVVVLWVAGGIVPLWFASDDGVKAGEIGDMFGGINALFSGLAFVGLVYTLLQQREELKLQREEMQQMREQYERSAEAQEGAEVLLRLQAQATLIATQISAYETIATVKKTQGGIQDAPEMLAGIRSLMDEAKVTLVKLNGPQADDPEGDNK